MNYNNIDDIARKADDLANGAFSRILRTGMSIFDEGAQAKSINEARGLLGTVSRMVPRKDRAAQSFGNALTDSFSQGVTGGGLNWGTVAGSYIGAAATYRGLSGGGVYRDASGSTNLVGVPFV